MKISLRQSGGFAASASAGAGTRVLDTNVLDDTRAGELRTLVERSGLLDRPERTHRNSRSADAMTYEITIETDGRHHRCVFDDMTLPERVIPLLEFLLEQKP